MGGDLWLPGTPHLEFLPLSRMEPRVTTAFTERLMHVSLVFMCLRTRRDGSCHWLSSKLGKLRLRGV